MKRIIAIVLLCWSAGVMAEPIELICKDDDEKRTLIIDLERNTVAYDITDPVEIYYKDDDYVVWMRHYPDYYIATYVLARKTGILRANTFLYTYDGYNIESTFQCFKPLL